MGSLRVQWGRWRAAHLTLIVGYDDSTDPKNPYRLVVNSWGAPKNRHRMARYNCP